MRRLAIALALVLALIPALAAAQNTGVNPIPGSVWTYLGPTYGAGWAIDVAGARHVPSNGVLAGTAIAAYPGGVWRDDYAVGLGAPPLWFMPETGTCAANGRVSDGGSCVDTVAGDNNSWYAAWGTVLDAREWTSYTGLVTYLGTAPSAGHVVGGSGGLGNFNPYKAVYPGGVGTSGLSYPDTNPAQNNVFTGGVAGNPGGALINNNPYPFGDLDTSVACSFSVGGNFPSGSTGYTDFRQMGSLGISDAIGCTLNAYTLPPLGDAPIAGTFDATHFTPTINLTTVNVTHPFQSATKVPLQSLLKVGMWLRTNDPVPWWGYITNVGTGAGVTVIGWVQQGTNTAGTPSGSAVVVNDERGWYAGLLAAYSNALCTGAPCTQPVGTLANGSTTITSVSDMTGMFAGQLIGSAHLATTVIKTVGVGTITVYGPGATGNASGEALSIAASISDQFRGAEIDSFNYGPPFQVFVPTKVTGCTATAGTYQLTGCSTIPNTVRPHHLAYPSLSNIVLAASEVLSVDSATSVTLAQRSLASGTVDITFYTHPDEGGIGFDLAGTAGNSQAALGVRGNFAYGLQVHGAFDSGVYVGMDGLGPAPTYGIHIDCSIACPANYAFYLGNARTGVGLAAIDPVGNFSGAGKGTFSQLNIPNGGSVAIPVGYSALFHNGTNANLLIAPGSFVGVSGAVGLLSQNDALGAPQPLAVSASQFVVVGMPTSCTGLATGALINTAGVVHVC